MPRLIFFVFAALLCAQDAPVQGRIVVDGNYEVPTGLHVPKDQVEVVSNCEYSIRGGSERKRGKKVEITEILVTSHGPGNCTYKITKKSKEDGK